MQTEYGLSLAFIYIVYAHSIELDVVRHKREIGQSGKAFVWSTDNRHAYTSCSACDAVEMIYICAPICQSVILGI
jgi:hypothetical protein